MNNNNSSYNNNYNNYNNNYNRSGYEHGGSYQYNNGYPNSGVGNSNGYQQDRSGGGSNDIYKCIEYQDLTKAIQQINNSISNLSYLVQQIGTQRDNQETRQKIRSCVSTTTQLISKESPKAKTLNSLAIKSQDQRTKLAYQKLVKEFNNGLKQFKELAQVVTKKERETPIPFSTTQHQQQSSNVISPHQQQQQYRGNQQQIPYYEEADKLEETQSLMEATRRQQLAQIESEREYQYSIIQEREQGIREIEKSIQEIGEIFADLHTMVINDGYLLNNIESNIYAASENTHEGVMQIKKASQYQRSARTKLCWLALILFIVAGVLALILYLSLRK
ncbi:hypothetical protein PPL_06743 [Heterostelium album PN500]|uniref:t-SNARE coiled-coil homology domain-containing protein n=1 Tax=Heterostelium pallidum (strain ATCC 26659 / Pp 5 / PN500) TaxID=670386 RepID=D3BFK9_HETP5|nr:hypothetical protein PPL_06743 [Heterostelium album PN500]EFA79923.1 hypothetical protein PPL_06743 [Heterostelium album PN500]|eukprot:XP_020432043.1 hypothetical protein PPL_06743 [Heterostelium album PN500]